MVQSSKNKAQQTLENIFIKKVVHYRVKHKL
jgi:hypothetical protein